MGLLAILALIVGATVVGYNAFQDAVDTRAGGGSTDDAGVIEAGTTVPTSVPNANQVIVLGTITSIHLDGARLDALPMPLTVTAPQGEGAASFQNVLVGGATTDIEWNAGTPLNLSSDGGYIVTGPLTLDADPSSMVIHFGQLPHGFAAGTYQITSSVAVGTGSLAQAVDQVAFSVDGSSSLSFRGDTSATFGPLSLSTRGTGNVVITGDLTIVRPDRSQTKIASITLESGPFDAALTPIAGTVSVHATLQGSVTTA